MGNLPENRVQPNRPFSVVGIDYAGPVYIKQSMCRNASLKKGYICLLICFTIKAVHLEIVTDSSSMAFIAAFKRFIGCRGVPNHVYSDNAKNICSSLQGIEGIVQFASISSLQEILNRLAMNIT